MSTTRSRERDRARRRERELTTVEYLHRAIAPFKPCSNEQAYAHTYTETHTYKRTGSRQQSARNNNRTSP